MRFTIIGAGGVGVVLGVALEHMKHEVAYLVRPGRKRAIRSFLLVDAPSGEARRRDAPTVYEVGSKVPPHEWVLVCVRGDQLDEALDVLAKHARPDAAVGFAAATLDGLARARAAHAGGPVFSIWPTFSSWTEDDKGEEGVYRMFKAPFVPTLVSGEGDERGQRAAEEFAAALEAAGLRARAVPTTQRIALPLIAPGVALLGAWEVAAWDADRLASDRELRKLTAAAMREAARVACAEAGGALATALRWTPAPAMSLALRALPRVAKGNIGAMWQHHGPKIGGQTRQMIDSLLARAEAHGLEVPRLRELRARMP